MFVRQTPAALAAALLVTAGIALAQPAPASAPAARRGSPPAPASASAGTQQSVTGVLQRWLLNPNGEADGLLLADGTQVAFPPHLSAQLLGAAKAKDTLQITGWREGNAGGMLRATSIKSVASGRTVTDEPPVVGAAPRASGAPSSLIAMNASGRIDRVLRGPRGEADGVLIHSGDGVVVRFPPHVAAQLGAGLAVGSTLYASGYGTRNDLGSAFEATRIGTTADTSRDIFGPPAGPRGEPPGARPSSPDRGAVAAGGRSGPRPPRPDGIAPPQTGRRPLPLDGAAPPAPGARPTTERIAPVAPVAPGAPGALPTPPDGVAPPQPSSATAPLQ